MSPPGVANSCWWVSRYQQGCCYWWETDPAGGYPATSKAVATGGSHAPRGEWRPKGSWAACTIAGNTSGRLRRHSLGRADLLPVAAGLGDHPATTEAVATGGSHALRAVRRIDEWRPQGSWAACTIAGNTSGRLRRHSLGRADLPPVAAILGDHPATTEAVPSVGYPATTEAVATGGRHAPRAVRRFGESRGHSISHKRHSGKTLTTPLAVSLQPGLLP